MNFTEMLKGKYQWSTNTGEEMCTLSEISKRASYLGYFTIEGGRMPFTKAEGLRRKDVKALGDVVYFMFVDNELMKIGKAGGASGFASRAETYSRGVYGDATNRKIWDVMNSLNKDRIEVFYVQCPKHVIEYNCPLTNDLLTEEVSTHKNVEVRLTQKYLSEDESRDLPFCHQLN